MSRHNKWGGTRKGAGRKPSPSRLSQIQAKVAPDVKVWYQDEAERRNVSVSSLVALALKEWAAQSNKGLEPTPLAGSTSTDEQ
jgi:hypothetical protein